MQNDLKFKETTSINDVYISMAISVTVHGSVCSFCVRLWGGSARCACQRCLAPDEVIRTVTAVAGLHCL